jgi:hypothetical protein
MSNHLVPEPRVNKNGITVIKHVRPEQADTSLQRQLPVPTISAPPVAVEVENEAPDYDAVIQRNGDFLRNTEPVTLTVNDLTAFSDILEYASKRDDDGYDKVWSAGQFVKHGNSGAAKTLIAHIEEHESHYSDHTKLFEAWSYGCDAGVFEQGKDYSADPEDLKYFSFIVKTFQAAEYENPLNEASVESIQRVATVFHELGGTVDPDELAEYWEERGEIDSFVDYSKEHNAIRSGTL